MPRDGKQTLMMRQDGFVTMHELTDAVGRDPSTVYKWIVEGKVPGGRSGWHWYVDIYAYLDQVRKEKLFPEDSVVMKNLRRLRGLVAKRATVKLPHTYTPASRRRRTA